MSVSHYNDLDELPKHVLEQVHRFFEDYKKMENKIVKVEKFEGKERAFEIINKAIELYRTTFG
jgi:inorganic pyrophosphatase